ncbi:NEL-type E3 ubiquitin ligase domain-containing protein [Pseudomonas sp. NPDC089407]|uniref:NEL-type E3 ubiquitin ligase domain-containing protein n=1 Tax=Pseudomonas sp. NPDC089407 TaxID=3364464 RepID=UPI003850B5F1
MAPNQRFTPASVEELVAQQIPAWLATAEPTHLAGYHQALAWHQRLAEDVQHVLASIVSIDAFATPLLRSALRDAGLDEVDPARAYVQISEEFQLPSAAEKLYKPSITHTTRQSLLAAALHNFEAHETQPWLLRKAHLATHDGTRLGMTFERFTHLCRTLDIGAQYQTHLNTVLQPRAGRGQPADHNRKVIEQQFEDSVRAQLTTSVYEARLKRQLDERDLQRLLSMLDPLPSASSTGAFTPRQLYLLGKCMVSIIALEWRTTGHSEVDEVVVWIPGDPDKQLHFYDSWPEVYRDLAIRLQSTPFRSFFKRFVKARDRSQFELALSAQLAPGNRTAVELDGRHLAVQGDVFKHVRSLLVSKLYDDARYVAVPTGDQNRLSRHRRLQEMLSAGLDLLGLAAFVVPALGEVLLVVSAAQLLDEVYEGFQDWQLGNRQGALDHLFAVAQTLALAGATVGAVAALKRVPFIEALEPACVAGSRLRLRHNPRYAAAEEGPLTLLAGLDGDSFAQLGSDQAEYLLQATGTRLDNLRRLHLERAPVPARLLDMAERLELHARHPELHGVALDAALTAQRPAVTAGQQLLLKAFEGLSARGAKEIIDHATATQQALLGGGRIPLAMAERARWYIRDTRVDRACLGIRLHKMVNGDTEQLVLGLTEGKAPWAASQRIELRLGSRDGLLLWASSSKPAQKLATIIRHTDGYTVVNEAGQPGPAGKLSFLNAVLHNLDDQQKAALVAPGMRLQQLRDWLLESAAAERERAASLIGLPAVGAGVRPPRRFADGRLGYPLSGGGESSGRAIRRGIHQIFPTLSETQLDAYIDAVRQRGDNLWNHYMMLQRQLTQLRETLRAWQSDWASPADAIRRRRVADTLRRSWRRKLVDGADQYELTIDGEQVRALPTLPPGVDFVHVQRLALRNMRLENIDAQFLALFPNLVDLDLSGNRFERIPEGIEHLTQLRALNLGNNRIEMDEAGSVRLSQLRRLDTLILSYNPLNGLPDLSALPHIRDVRLRSTGQTDVSRLHQHFAWQAHIDLRDNTITELRREMRGLQLRLQRLNLHDNPLTEESALYYDDARGVTDTGARGSVSYQHRLLNEETRSLWVATSNDLLRAQREGTWDTLLQESGSAGLFRFLADFTATEDFLTEPQHYRGRIWRVLDACENNEALREHLFREADAPRSCEDRLLLLLNQMEVGILAYQGIDGLPLASREARLLRLGRQLHRLDLLDNVANRHTQRLLREGLRRVDEIEVRLYYRSRLSAALDLPVQPDEMHFASFANVSSADLTRAEIEVLRANTPVAMLASLADRHFWQTYLRQTYPERFEAVAAPFHERMEALEAHARLSQENDYVQRASELMRQHAAEESNLIRTLTAEIWARSQYANPERLV